MSNRIHLMEQGLDEIQSFCDNDVRRPSMATRAHQIYLIAADVALHLKRRPQEPEPPTFTNPREFFPYVYTLAFEAKRALSSTDTQYREVMASKKVAEIRSAMRKAKSLCDDPRTVASLSDTTASEATLSIAIKHFLPGGGVREKRIDFNHVPDFLHLHDLGQELLKEHNLNLCEFNLELDDNILENRNTRQVLRTLQADGARAVCIYLKFQGPHPRTLTIEEAPVKLLVCIEGNIGSRKSELMQKLLVINEQSGQQRVQVEREPLEKLSQEMIDFYKALLAGEEVSEEQRALSSRFEEGMFEHHFKVATNPERRARHVISERSMEAKIHVFNELNFKQKRLSEDSRNKMKTKFEEQIRGRKSHEPHAIIFCDITVQQAIEKIRSRGRESEESITHEYLTEIEKLYGDLYPAGAPHVIRLESDHPMEDIIVAIQNQLPRVLKDRSDASDADIAEFMRFFKDLRGEPGSCTT